MENERKENKRQFVEDKGQKFYFNEEGRLIVETNKGVWDDGTPYVKMYGNFSCNAKTLGIIINKFKGCPVVVTETKKGCYFDLYAREDYKKTTAIVNPTDEDKELMEELSVVRDQRDGLDKLKIELLEANDKFEKAIKKYNALPWWKRLFKKIEVK